MTKDSIDTVARARDNDIAILVAQIRHLEEIAGPLEDEDAALVYQIESDLNARAALAAIPKHTQEPVANEEYGWVYFNPDSGEEYRPDHPIVSGECEGAQNIRPATAQEQHLWGLWQASLAPEPKPDQEQRLREATTATWDAWNDLVNKDDRNSPEDYPEMCLITFDELQGYIAAALSDKPETTEPAAMPEPKLGPIDDKYLSQRMLERKYWLRRANAMQNSIPAAMPEPEGEAVGWRRMGKYGWHYRSIPPSAHSPANWEPLYATPPSVDRAVKEEREALRQEIAAAYMQGYLQGGIDAKAGYSRDIHWAAGNYRDSRISSFKPERLDRSRTVSPSSEGEEREAFLAWLFNEQGLTATWNENRNCFDELSAHIAFKAWLAAIRSRTVSPSSAPIEPKPAENAEVGE